MPQNEPMSAEGACKNIARAMRSGNGKLALQILAIHDAQLIRSTLEAAAERARSWYIRTAGVEGCKSLEDAILDPSMAPRPGHNGQR